MTEHTDIVRLDATGNVHVSRDLTSEEAEHAIVVLCQALVPTHAFMAHLSPQGQDYIVQVARNRILQIFAERRIAKDRFVAMLRDVANLIEESTNS